MDKFFTSLFEYIGTHLPEHELQLFVENLLVPNMFVAFPYEQYQRLLTSYNTHVRPKLSTLFNKHPFQLTIEERLAFLEQEHLSTRVIQASFVDLLREHRESFDIQLAHLNASISSNEK
jgi:hypothetical protein